MLHLIKYNLLVKLKNFGTTFWPLVFPILLGTMFYFAFGNINDADFATVSVAVVRQEKADTLFLMFLDQVENNADQLISTKELTYDEACSQLENEQISGIYVVGETPSLTVSASGIPQSILQSVLSSYETGKTTIRTIVRTHPSRPMGRDPADAEPVRSFLLRFPLADGPSTETPSFSMR